MLTEGAGIPAFYTATGVGTILVEVRLQLTRKHGGFPIKVNPSDLDNPVIASQPREVASAAEA